MNVTVCELPDARYEFSRAWEALVEHSLAERSDLVLLPSLPFSAWFAAAQAVDPKVWSEAVRAHDAWEARLQALAPAMVASTRPIDFGYERYLEGFVWTSEAGLRSIHASSALLEDRQYGAASSYDGAPPALIPQEVNGVSVGFLFDRELSSLQEAQGYRTDAVQLLLAPRCTDNDPRWLAAAQETAAAAHAYVISSNRAGSRRFGGVGWIIDPEGQVLARTDKRQPFATSTIDIPVHPLPLLSSIRHTAQTLGYGGLRML